jgi:hypothetical protein
VTTVTWQCLCGLAEPHGFCLREVDELRGNAIRQPALSFSFFFAKGNLRFRPHVAFKTTPTSVEMEELLTHHALLVKVVGPLRLRSNEELKDIIFHHFGIHKNKIYIYRSYLDLFIVVFPIRHVMDVVFASDRIIDSPVELSFSAWDLDGFGDRTNIPYHIKLSIKEISQHAWV